VCGIIAVDVRHVGVLGGERREGRGEERGERRGERRVER
jgi:hypothetical protein